MRWLERVHDRYIPHRRVRILSQRLSGLVPKSAQVLDVGCGDGWLGHYLVQARPDVSVQGVETLVRAGTPIPVARFDGHAIPYPDATFDVVMFVDVLHHLVDPVLLLREAVRVSRRHLLIKDHVLSGLLAGATLRFMDRLGNERFGVTLPYNYWPQDRWLAEFESLALRVETWQQRDLRLYPRPARWMFERSLHFIARIAKRASDGTSDGDGMLVARERRLECQWP